MVNTSVIEWSEQNDHITVTTAKGSFETQQLVISAGPWIREVVPQLSDAAMVYRQSLIWYELENGFQETYAPDNFPVYIWNTPDLAFYGFPALGDASDGIKVASEKYDSTTTPETISRDITEHEVKELFEGAFKGRFKGVKANSVRATTCMYTVLPNWTFVIDRHPEHDRVIVASPCSGHGFKHSAAIGETLAQMALGQEPTLDVSPFAFSRLSD